MTGNGVRDFNFLKGRWTVRHRKLKARLAGSTEWLEFTGRAESFHVMGETALVDDNFLDDPTGAYRAVSLRHFDAKSAKWSIWWFDERYLPAPAGEPMRGGFDNGVGVFLADETFNDKPIVVRFRWYDITDTTARWEQAFSPDGGQTWEVNWDMWFTRVT